METLKTVVAVAVPLVAVAVQLRGLLTRRLRDVPPRIDDDVRVLELTTRDVQHSTTKQLRRRWRLSALGVGIISVGLLAAVTTAIQGLHARAAVVAAEALVLLPTALLNVIYLRRARGGEPIGQQSHSLVVCGPLDQLAARVHRAFVALGAVRVRGSALDTTAEGFTARGGTGPWGIEGEKGYEVVVTATPGGDERWLVTVESRNYAPSWVQALRNQQNVGFIVDYVLA